MLTCASHGRTFDILRTFGMTMGLLVWAGRVVRRIGHCNRSLGTFVSVTMTQGRLSLTIRQRLWDSEITCTGCEVLVFVLNPETERRDYLEECRMHAL
jgi:hypothetical protein